MGQSPFSKRLFLRDIDDNERRSTRVNHACPVIISGRDARGEFFREEAETSVVNLHGCKVRLKHEVLVGVQLTIESLCAEAPAKAICVRVLEPGPGEERPEVALQLLKPHNIWGVENPPSDWRAVAEAMVHGRARRPGPQVLAATPPSVPTPSATLATAPTAPAALPPDPKLIELEDRAWQLVDSILQTLRNQTEELLTESLEEFREQLAVLSRDAHARFRQLATATHEEVEASLLELRADLAEQLAMRTDQVVKNTEEALREKVTELLSSLVKPAEAKPPSK